MYNDDPTWQMMFNLFGAMYHAHPIREDVAGTLESIARITPECLQRCYDTFYNLHHMVLVVAGQAEPEKVCEVCDRMLRTDPPVTVERILPEEPADVAAPYVEKFMPVALPSFELGFKCDSACTRNETFSAAVDVLLEILASNASVLFKKLTDACVISESSFGYEYFEGSGFAMTLFSGESQDPEKAKEIILEEIRRLKDEGISQEDFERARRCIYGSNVASFNSIEHVATTLMLFAFKDYDLFRYIDAIANLTPEDVMSCLHTLFDPTRLSLSVVWPLPEEKEI